MSDLPPPPRGPRDRPPDFEELVGHDLPEAERARLRRVDSMLRSVPAPPPAVPARIESAVVSLAQPRARVWTPRRVAFAVPLAAALALVFFALGALVGGGGENFDERATVRMQPTAQTPAEARSASAVIRVGEADENGNWPLRLEVEGLPRLPKGGYYALWLSKDGEFGATCGSFAMGEGETTATWTVSYPLGDYDAWVITAYLPNEPVATERPWLLEASARI
jgi:hypothetical protein